MNHEEIIEGLRTMMFNMPRFRRGSVGNVSLSSFRMKAGERHTVISARESILAFISGDAMRGLTLSLDHPYDVWELKDKDQGTWMSTRLQELRQMLPVISRAHGRVLIGGLGMGIIAHQLMQKCDSVTVIEKDPDIIELIQTRTSLDPRVDVIQADLFDYLKVIAPGQHDYAFFDILQMTGEWTWQTQVVPLLRLARPNIAQIDCWQEDEMLRQVEEGMYVACDIPHGEFEDSAATAHKWVFGKYCQRYNPPRLSMNSLRGDVFFNLETARTENRNDPRLRRQVDRYLHDVGHPEWERDFGSLWDQTLPLYERQYA